MRFKARLIPAHNIDDLAALPTGDIKGKDQQEDNDARASFGAAILVEFARLTGDMGEPLDDILTDLLADLRHMCDAAGTVDYNSADASAFNHYHAEIEGRF